MSDDERLDLVRRLQAESERRWAAGLANPRLRRRTLAITTAASLGLIPWTIYLAYKLPHTYRAYDWTLTWVGFDVALGVSLAATAFLAWKRRQLVILAAFSASVLLACDAWFDITTSSSEDFHASLFAALAIELPLAGRLFWTALRAVRFSVVRMWELTGRGEAPPLWKAPIFAITVENRPA